MSAITLIESFFALFIGKKTTPDDEYKKMKKVFATPAEVRAFLKEKTGCDNITINDRTLLLVDKEWAMRRLAEFGVNKLKYKPDLDIFAELDQIQNSTKLTAAEKTVKIEELLNTINFDCDDFGDVLKAEFIKINGWLCVGRVDGRKTENGNVSAHAFNFMITTEWELIYIEPQTNGTWTPETNKWIPYKIDK